MSRKEKSRAGVQSALLLAAAALFCAAAGWIASRAERAHVGGAVPSPRISPLPEIATTTPVTQPPTDTTLRDWAAHSPQESWPWLRDNSARLSAPDEPSLIAVFFRHLAARDPDAVLALADESFARADGAAIAATAIDALLENNWPDLAQRHVEQWAAGPNARALGADVFQAIAWRLARESDRVAADWLTRLPPSTGRDAAFAGTAANWAEHDPAAAIAWAVELPAGAARTGALERTFRIWADHDASTAADWLLQHESRPEADRLIAAWLAASPAAADNPQLALQWVGLIRDDSARRESRALVLARWHDRDADAAAHYIAIAP